MISRKTKRIVGFGALFLLVAACAGTEEYLRSTPATHFPTGQSLTLDTNLSEIMTLHCLKTSKIKYEDTSGPGSKEEECLYISASITKFAAADSSARIRNHAIDTLLSVSDINCSTFLNRAFANRAGLDYTKTLLQDLATAGSAGVATVSAPLSAGLSGTNLLVGKSVDTFTATYYVQQTFQAMETAIDASRQTVRAQILSHEAVPVPSSAPDSVASAPEASGPHASAPDASAPSPQTYSFADALAEIREYDDACSIKGGLAKLNTAATNSKKTAQQCVASVKSKDSANAKAQAAQQCPSS
jgi:hypothetical protein